MLRSLLLSRRARTARRTPHVAWSRLSVLVLAGGSPPLLLLHIPLELLELVQEWVARGHVGAEDRGGHLILEALVIAADSHALRLSRGAQDEGVELLDFPLERGDIAVDALAALPRLPVRRHRQVALLPHLLPLLKEAPRRAFVVALQRLARLVLQPLEGFVEPQRTQPRRLARVRRGL